jgi:hypothetical protein
MFIIGGLLAMWSSLELSQGALSYLH